MIGAHIIHSDNALLGVRMHDYLIALLRSVIGHIMSLRILKVLSFSLFLLSLFLSLPVCLRNYNRYR